ncbi:MAG: segregation and condensation protein A [Patescibacteria group bacterium]
MAYQVNIEHFEGPLDLLLQLVERNELEISQISLANVAQQFVNYMQNYSVQPEEMADFLVVASKLIYLKSKLLMPDFQDDEMDEGPDLETQLRQYQMFVAAAREIDKIWQSGYRSYSRKPSANTRREIEFVIPANVTIEILQETMKRVIARIEPILRLPKAAIKRAVSIQERIRSLYRKVQQHSRLTFKQFITGVKYKDEAIVGFLAVLELVKQRFISVDQGELFAEINISKHPDAPERDPLAESFI